MPRPKKKVLDPSFESISPEDVRCTICDQVAPTRSTLKLKSAGKHLETQFHISNVGIVDQRRKDEQERLARRAAIYAPRAMPNPAYNPPPVLPRPSMFDHVPFDAPDPSTLIPTDMQVDEPLDVEAERRRLQSLVDLLLDQAYHEEEYGAEDDGEEAVNPINLSGDDVDIDLDFDEVNEATDGVYNGRFKPYPNKISMLLDVIDNLPRMRLSSAHLRIIMWLLKECGVRNVPSYDRFRKTQRDLGALCGVETVPHKSMFGNKFFVNDVAQSIALDFANPHVAPLLHFYPEEVSGPISEVWQADRWKEYKAEDLTPMYSRENKRFFIEELCQLDDGTYVIPHDWVIRNGSLTARCTVVQPTPAGLWMISAEERIALATSFAYTYEEVVARIGKPPEWDSGCEKAPHTMPNPLRDLAPDCDIFVVMVPLWVDDVSGNRSKQYNKHINMYMANSNLPGRLLQQEFFVRFVSTSPHASSPEQFAAVRDQINATQSKPVRCYNAASGRECAIILRVPGLPADNPQQSEEASHIGGNGNYPCRKCELGGTQAFKETCDGYHAYHYAGIARDASNIRQELQRQLDVAMLGVANNVKQMQTATGTKDKVTQFWIEKLLAKAQEEKKKNSSRSAQDIAAELRIWLDQQPGDKMNPLLDIAGLDPSQDTPVEILHTVLLGVVKYAWYMMHTSWKEDERNLFVARLQSTDLGGLSIPSIRAGYMMQYRNNLIGKDFKTIMQTAPFHVHGISEATSKHADRFPMLKAIGELGALLWAHTIDDMDQFLGDIEILTANVLDSFDMVDCKKITTKIKLHLLPHLVQDIRRFGPAIRNSTEVFECFNAVFRQCSILSNHHAPSRDIAIKLSSFDRVKHLLSGGFWKENGSWVQASEAVQDVLMRQPIIQRHLGWVPAGQDRAGSVTAEGKKIPPCRWSKTHAGAASGTSNIPVHDPDSLWRMGKSAIARSGDPCHPGSWIFAEVETEPAQKSTVIGRVKEILLQSSDARAHPQASDAIILLEVFELGQNRHPDFNAPVLSRPVDSGRRLRLLRPEDLCFAFSAQHDCRTFECDTFAEVTEIQEHEKTDRKRKILLHNDDDHFVVNIYAIHNAVELRRAVDRELIKPIPLFSDRRAHHDTCAKQLHITQKSRREMLALRRRQKKTQLEEAEAQAQQEDDENDDEEEGSEDDSESDSEVEEDAEMDGDEEENELEEQRGVDEGTAHRRKRKRRRRG
ncbi:uncharacterized protein SCHCODRAFT_02691594 [Schizophyllum commune H4-8]|uniref:Uncharacterized protein n=1 Tax=Schizophyllum commune (strain H4-8 / FGSC 9210) TaxID=578458 RepID=D8QES9_SCHCM|nr:uncharacterized protein SCHCODRAFT_02691594 [Schizophyllum commune H4-8]KAI5888159.1 hypothetical protein SCHCODRAFT_02691594 [Schizophyllum commune H4-8]